mmetsp:Transcript_16257/g.48423  ORF Transcript_16257/g.48423 Transcript_16257/m.48423 type:complete len:233 (-) Transcript_16257:2063-2761(-)
MAVDAGAEPLRLSVGLLEKLRAELEAELGRDVAALVSDEATLQRFFRATGGSYKESRSRLLEHAEWRAEVGPETMECSACESDPHSHYMHLIGHDKQGRPVMYSTFALAENKSLGPLVDHMIQAFELAVRAMPPGVESWVWLNDFAGFGLADCHPGLAMSFIELSGVHYPERLGQLLALDAPSMMTPVWNMVKPFIDPVRRPGHSCHAGGARVRNSQCERRFKRTTGPDLDL